MKNQPALKAVLFLSAGIGLSRFEWFSFQVIWTAGFISLVSLLLLYFLKKAERFFQCLLILSILLLGYVRGYQRRAVFPPNHILHFIQPEETVLVNGFLVKDPVSKNRRFEWIMAVDSVCRGGCSYKSVGKISVSSYSDLTRPLQYGDAITVSGVLERPKARRNPGGFDYRAYLERRGVYALIRVKDDFAIQQTGQKRGNWFLREWIYPTRRKIIQMIEKTASGQSRAILKALIVGERSDISPEVRDDFANAGVIHVLAVSGLHVGFVVLIFLTIFGLLRFPYTVRVLLTMGGLVVFVLLTEAKAPVARASIMSGLYLMGTLFERRPEPYNIIGLAGLILLLINPLDLFDVGFQLSFAAVFSIVYFYQKFRNLPFAVTLQNRFFKNRFGRFVYPALLVSLSAQLGTLPLIAVYFNRIPLLALLINLIAIPVVGLVVALGFTTLIFSLFSFWMASVYGALNQEILTLFIKIIHWFGRLSFAYVTVPSPDMWAILFYFSIVLLLMHMHDGRGRKQFVFAVLICGNLWIWKQAIWSESNKLTWIQFDVGQGDAGLVRLPRGKAVLIDGGEKNPYFDNGERVIAPYFRKKGIRKLDLVILTHPHNDHVGGLNYILDHFNVSSIVTAGTAFDSKLYHGFLTLIEKHHIPHSIITAPDSICFPGVQMVILSPTPDIKSNSRNVNNQSVVVRLSYGHVQLLFMGDAESAVEKMLLSSRKNLRADALKVGHHGSITSSTQPFLKEVAPDYGVISVGENNRFGHPSDVVIQRLCDMDADISRTDQEGAVIFRTDGNTLQKIDW